MTSPAERKIGEPQNLPAYVMTSWATLFSLHALATLKVADHMSDDPVSIEALASAAGTHAEPLRRVMNLLVAEGLVGSTADGRVMHNEYSRMLRSEHPSSIRAMLSMRNHPEAALRLAEGLVTGQTPFVLRFGKPLFEHMAENPQVAQTFAEFMSATTAWTEHAIFQGHNFRPFNLAVDVGGSHGTLLRGLLARHPDAHGIVFDLPHVAEQVAASSMDPLAGRIRTIGGDFFSWVPEGADLYLLKQILHDWNDAQCIAILRNIRRAIAPQGRLVIIEQLLPETRTPDLVWAMDFWMLVLASGRERSLSDFKRLLHAADFSYDRVTRTDSPVNVVEAVAS